MIAITNFKVEDDLGNYDKRLNPNMLSVGELLPKRVSWLHNGKKVTIKDNDSIVPLLLINDNGVALIKAPYDPDKNQAYIIDVAGVVRWNLKSINDVKIKNATFYDVYYISDMLFFFINNEERDYRFSFDVNTGTSGRLLPAY